MSKVKDLIKPSPTQLSVRAKESILSGDIIISLQATKVSSLLLTSGCKIFIKTKTGHKQIGLIQKIKLSANSKKVPVDLEIIFSQVPTIPGTLSHKIIKGDKKLFKKYRNIRIK
jgi:hypothetical protein